MAVTGGEGGFDGNLGFVVGYLEDAEAQDRHLDAIVESHGIHSLAVALQLDEAERAHLLDLAKAAAPTRAPGTRRVRAEVRPTVLQILAGMTGTPAYVRNSRMDIVAANSLCFTLYTDILSPDTLPLNLARLMFLDPRSQDFFVEWATIADDLAAAVRTESGRNPGDRALNSLIGDLATGSTEFATRWARHNVRFHRSARKALHNPLVGDIELTGDSLDAYWLTPYGSPGSTDTTYIIGHSWEGRESAFNDLSSRARPGNQLIVTTAAGPATYTVKTITTEDKDTLRDSPIWDRVPNRLILVSCYTADLRGTNIIVTADLEPLP